MNRAVRFAAGAWVVISAVSGCDRPAPQSVSAQQADDSLQLMQLESRWNEAHLRGDADALDRLWDEQLVVMVPGMAPMDKQAVLGFARSGRMRFDRYETSDIRIRVHGDAAVVTGLLWRARTLQEQAVEDDWQFMKVYARRHREWRVVAFGASPAPG